MNSSSPASRPRWLSVVGVLGVIALGFTVWLGLWITPPDVVQGNLARLLYIHPPIATVALYWAGGVALAGSLFYLWPRTRSFFWDRLAAAAVEVGAVFSALTCVTGSIWGRPAWGVWWAWDARLTSTALLFLLELGYLALRRVPADPAKMYPLDVDRAFRKLDEIKPHVETWWVTGTEPQYVSEYHAVHPTFPHETTGD